MQETGTTVLAVDAGRTLMLDKRTDAAHAADEAGSPSQGISGS